MSELRMYSTSEFADIMGVTHRTAWQYVKDGKVKAMKIGNVWKISEEHLKEFMSKVDNQPKEKM